MHTHRAPSPNCFDLGPYIFARRSEIGNRDEGSYTCWTISAGIEVDICCVMLGGLGQALLFEPNIRTLRSLMLYGYPYDSPELHDVLLVAISAAW